MKATARCGSVVLAAVLGCSGRYEVGELGASAAGKAGAAPSEAVDRDSTGGSSTSNGSGGAGSSSTDSAGARAGGGSLPTAQSGPGDEFGPDCVPSGQPEIIDGELASPELVWSRLALLIWGDSAAPPPAELPATTTYEWAADVVTRAFAEMPGEAPGAERFIEHWIFADRHLSPEDPPLLAPWGELLSDDSPALERLLTNRLSDDRYGLFNEPRFLERWPSISSRGARISSALLQPIPPAPAGTKMPTEPLPGMTYRQSLETWVESPPCRACHEAFDPLGYAFDSFGRDGAYRTRDNGLPIDASGTYTFKNGREVSFDGSRALGHALAGSCDGQVGLAAAFLTAALELDGAPDVPAQFEMDHARVEQAFVRSPHRSYADLVRAFAQTRFVLLP